MKSAFLFVLEKARLDNGRIFIHCLGKDKNFSIEMY